MPKLPPLKNRWIVPTGRSIVEIGGGGMAAEPLSYEVPMRHLFDYIRAFAVDNRLAGSIIHGKCRG